ncbi:hypothetical protein TrST_g12177 [Triparma strigata]|uniref:Uncharacterized protein n=1 Tax=Triparma strigata TaxID=1606541 RepID=A0A9W6ZKJ6_9STRA|nr:hypothetical protein TrST_g12177 [Triparma strigata]
MSVLFGKRSKKRKSSERSQEPASDPQPVNVDQTEGNYVKHTTFASLKLPQPLIASLKTLKINKPSRIQSLSIPPILLGSHLFGLASTGSGKTLAFALPILTTLSNDPYGVYCVVLSPTRELSKQINEQISIVGSPYNIRSELIVGGGDMVRQSVGVGRKPHFIVGTPGRVRDILGQGDVRLKGCRYLVLDEADRLLSDRLNSGFGEDVMEIRRRCGEGRRCQVLAFSATGGPKVMGMVEALVGGERVVRIGGDVEEKGGVSEGEESEEEGVGEQKKKTNKKVDEDGEDKPTKKAKATAKKQAAIPAGLKQQYIFMPHALRDAYLVTCLQKMVWNGGVKADGEEEEGSGWTLKEESDDEGSGLAKSAVVFVGTCERAAHMEGTLRELGIDCVALHSLLSQDRRDAALGKFKSQRVRILIATDIASRGLDIPSVALVLNSELPRKASDYIHRVGRTARAGRRGTAVSLVGEEDISLVHACEALSGRSMQKNEDIKDKDVLKLLGSVAKASRLTKVRLDEVGFDKLVKKKEQRKEKDRKIRDKLIKRMSKDKKMKRKKKEEGEKEGKGKG